MRWFWIDRFTEFVSGQRAVAIKNVTLSEPHLHGYFSGYPVMPNPLILEGLAQTGGTLLGEVSQFKSRLVLAKVSKVHYHFLVRPGDTLHYVANLESVGPEGARIQAHSRVNDRVQCEAEFYLAILPSQHDAEQLFDPSTFARLLRVLGLYDVGVDADGRPLQMPSDLLDAEATAS